MQDILSTVPIVVVLAAIIMGAVTLYLARSRARAAIRAREGYSDADILLADRDAHLAQHPTAGGMATANGVLMLTKDALIFESLDGNPVRVPIEAVTRTERTVMTMGGKPMRPLLTVTYTNPDDEELRAAWLVQRAQDWQVQIERLRQELETGEDARGD